MTKKYISSWRPYEQPYVQAMALAGVGREECEDRLWAVNQRLKAPYRGYKAVLSMGSGFFRAHINATRATRNLHVTWAATRANTSVEGRFWEPYELAYIALLSNQQVSHKDITKRLERITKPLGRPIRSLHAVSRKLGELGRLPQTPAWRELEN